MLPNVTDTPPPLARAAYARGVHPAPIVLLIIVAIMGILVWSIEAGPLGKACRVHTSSSAVVLYLLVLAMITSFS